MTTLNDLPIRDSLRGKEAYGAPMNPVSIALNVNENTYSIEPEVLADIAAGLTAALVKANRYPDREANVLRQKLADYLNSQIVEGNEAAQLTLDQVWAANGSNEILQQILQAFGGPGRSLLSFTPTYSMYPILASNTDTAWISVERPPSFELTPEFVADQISEHSPALVILCGPNNPTGTKLSAETITAAYDAFDGMLIVDEAYIEFDEDLYSAINLLPGRPRLIVSRTMSKAFAFAGVRLGYMAADSAVVDALRLVRLPYHLSVLTQTAATIAVQHAPLMLQTVAAIRAQRDRLAGELASIGYQVHDSGGNFLLVSGFADPEATFEALLQKGILIRNLAIPNSLRLTAGTEAETTALIEALRELTPADLKAGRVDL